MDFNSIHQRLLAINAPGVLSADTPRAADPEDKADKGRAGEAFVLIDRSEALNFLLAVRDDAALAFDMLVDLTGTDPDAEDEDLWLNLHLLSLAHGHRLAVKAMVPKSNAVVPSMVAAHMAAHYHERECSEMFGIHFEGNPDLRNILLPDDWIGFPLRKDYEFPKEYHGVSCE
ncbi:MAG: NADH-quinone oxidoreductase subunit C [Planctomycetota bacterium]|nr:NADH-quinone oxidoreductase subunit C [Planctomycetota bacterium]